MQPVLLRPHHLVKGILKYLEWRQGLNDGERGRETNLRVTGSSFGNRFAALEDELIRNILDRQDLSVLVTDSWDVLCGVCEQKKEGKCQYEHEDPVEINLVRMMGIPIGQPVTSGYVVQQITNYFKTI